MRHFLVFIILIYSGNCYAQGRDVKKNEEEVKKYFSEQISLVRNNYIKKAKKDIQKGQIEDAKKHYKKLIKEELEGTYMDNFNASCLNTNKCCINDYNKPMILMTYASWCVPGKGEIPAVNQLSNHYEDEIDFVALFWDDKRNARKAARDLNNDIHVVYVDELQNRYAHTITMLKHSIGFPKVFSIGSDKKILRIKNTKNLPYHKDLDKSLKINLAFYKKLIQGIFDYEADGNRK